MCKSSQKVIRCKTFQKNNGIDKKTAKTSVQTLLSWNFHVNFFNTLEKRQPTALLLPTEGKRLDPPCAGFSGTLYEEKKV